LAKFQNLRKVVFILNSGNDDYPTLLKDEGESSSSDSSSESSSDDDNDDSDSSSSSSKKSKKEKKKFEMTLPKNCKFQIDLDAFFSHELTYLLKNFGLKYQEQDIKVKVGKLIIKQKGLGNPIADNNNHVDLCQHFIPRPTFNIF
jgi:hypothetical protein